MLPQVLRLQKGMNRSAGTQRRFNQARMLRTALAKIHYVTLLSASDRCTAGALQDGLAGNSARWQSSRCSMGYQRWRCENVSGVRFSSVLAYQARSRSQLAFAFWK